jgi:hypothetical protein
MIGGARDAEAFGFVRDLIGPRGFVVGMQKNVRVSFDQAGQKREGGEIDDAGAGGVYVCGGSGGVDALAADAHGPAFVGGFTIEDASGFEKDDGGVGVALASTAAPAKLSEPGLGENAK